ncbi:Mss4-like protein [Xylogone sp. PMI_703]|nr:Mss4-like protein [Xylogone sp. PMI_703]
MATTTTKTNGNFPLAGCARDGWSTEDEATATCFCGAVQLAFPTEGPGLLFRFICHCTDCRKVTASMFASNFAVALTHIKHLRGQDNLKTYSQSTTIATGSTMTNYFCNTCGTLMYRISTGYPDRAFMRIGTVDDFQLHETKLKPQTERYIETRVGWLRPAEGVEQVEVFTPTGVGAKLLSKKKL